MFNFWFYCLLICLLPLHQLFTQMIWTYWASTICLHIWCLEAKIHHFCVNFSWSINHFPQTGTQVIFITHFLQMCLIWRQIKVAVKFLSILMCSDKPRVHNFSVLWNCSISVRIIKSRQEGSHSGKNFLQMSVLNHKICGALLFST